MISNLAVNPAMKKPFSYTKCVAILKVSNLAVNLAA